MKRVIFKTSAILTLLLLTCCDSTNKKEIGQKLYTSKCAVCHLPPDINDLPKEIWRNHVLPDMAARLGIRDSTNNPYKGMSFEEQLVVMQKNIYPTSPTMSREDWELLKDYIINLAPDSLRSSLKSETSLNQKKFKTKPITLPINPRSIISTLNFKEKDNSLVLSCLDGMVFNYDLKKNETTPLGQYKNAITNYIEKDNKTYITSAGYLHPSERALGEITIIENNKTERLPDTLHRPVHTIVNDLNNDGNDEIIVSEFGHLTGNLSLFKKTKEGSFKKTVLLNLPGCIKIVVKDMDKDGKKDIIVLTGQAREGVSILYQKENLKFSNKTVLQFSPVYGTSWFDLIDYDGDGDQDIITVNGDNADLSIINKPYHGMRIHLNNGKNEFKEEFFYPLNGATRLIARDFDQDNDIDIALLAAFPDYDQNPEYSFVFLENKNTQTFTFNTYTFQEAILGRWLLMDAGDIDKDGDDDIILSSFNADRPNAPINILENWKKNKIHLLVLENQLK